jgi:tRNA dimethylallyltransferase
MTVIAIFGPTASGKSAVAEALVERIPAELVSADSMQVYRGLPILTNQSDYPTRLVGIWDLDHEATVGEYQELAHAAIDEILAAGRTPVVVGGTGLYFRAALAELELPPAVPPEARERLERLYERVGGERAHELLAERDPAAASAVHPNDRRRVVRALELAEAGSSLRPAEDRLWSGEARHPSLIVGLTLDREELRRRIEERTGQMFERGVEEEVRRARAAHAFSHTSARIHGLQDISALLDGAIGREEAIRRLEARTRRYAKRQRTWMRKLPGLITVDGDRPAASVADEIAGRL